VLEQRLLLDGVGKAAASDEAIVGGQRAGGVVELLVGAADVVVERREIEIRARGEELGERAPVLAGVVVGPAGEEMALGGLADGKLIAACRDGREQDDEPNPTYEDYAPPLAQDITERRPSSESAEVATGRYTWQGRI
jgi:hypothetical protein